MRSYFSNPSATNIGWLVIWDSLLVLSVFYSAYIFKILVVENRNILVIYDRIPWVVIVGVFLHIIMFYIFELYDQSAISNKRLLFVKIFLAVGLSSLMIILLSYAFPEAKMGRVVMFTHFAMMTAVIFVWRSWLAERFIIAPNHKILLVGSDDLISKIFCEARLFATGYSLAGIVSSCNDLKLPLLGNPAPTFADLDSAIQKTGSDVILVAEGFEEDLALQSNLIDLRFRGLQVFDGATFHQHIFGRVPVSDVKPSWLLFSRSGEAFQPAIYQRGRRIFELLFSSLILLMIFPLMIFIGILIKLESRGPILFRQERLGLNERPFLLMKFRTMVQDAEKATGPVWAQESDPRLTRIGKLLRKTRLDELPQFINVFLGDMSIVGPRPIRKHFADIFAEKFPFYRLRFRVKPGITGWAQVNMEYVNTEEDQYKKLEYEFYYVYHQSFLLDAFIIIKTIQSVLSLKGG